MKLRIVASSRDLIIFAIFAVFLLYVVALGVLNLPQLAGEGTFYGLNPIEAFSSDYILFTVVFYFLTLGGLVMSVSSYFFEWESGFGFGVSSGSKGGYSDWAKAKDIKEDTNIKKVNASDHTSKYAGVPLICNGKELWVDDGEYHTLVIGATGSGKTQSTILPTMKILAKKGESIICTDPKGELYEKTGGLLKEKGYNVILLNFRNPQNGNAWNPLALPYRLYKNGNQDKAIELLDDLALNILYDESSSNADPFWEKTAADYFAGIALAMFEDTTEDKININSINMTATVGEDKFGGSTYIKEYFNYKDPSSAAYVNASGTVMAPSDTKGGIISVFKQKVKLFASRENLSEMLSYSDFDLDSIGKRPTAVFIIIQDEKKTYHSLATIFIKQAYETLIDVAQSNGGKLPYRTNFLLDEFANMPPLKDVTTMITAARSRQIRFTMIIQNFAQLNKVYGKDDAETIKGNCGNIVYLISTELAALEEISKLCGEKKSKKDDKTASTPLVTVSDLQRMKKFDQIILRMRKNPFKTSFVPDFKIDWGSETSPKVDYPLREKKKVNIFDIRDFVKEKKNQKINEMMASMSDGDKGGSTASKNPFQQMPRDPFQRPMYNPPEGRMPKENSDLDTKPKPNISVSDLVKKIDQKLAEIEKEETENKANKKEPVPVPVKKEEKKYSVDDFLMQQEEKKETQKNKRVQYTPSKSFDEKTNDSKSFNKDIELLSEDEKEKNDKKEPKKEKEYVYIDSDSDLFAPILDKTDEDRIEKEMKKDAPSIDLTDDMIMDVDNQLKNTKFEEDNVDMGLFDLDDDITPKTEDIVIEERKEPEEIKQEQEKKETPVERKKTEEIFKPTPTIKLDDVKDDDNFFDDFFDD